MEEKELGLEVENEEENEEKAKTPRYEKIGGNKRKKEEDDIDDVFGSAEAEEENVEEVPVEEPKEEAKEEEVVTEEATTEESPKEEEPVIEAPKKTYPEKYTEVYPRPEARLAKPEGNNLLFYAERQNVIPTTGQVLYTGDDGLPYVDQNIILAADGVGGTSCIRHTKFNRGLFEEDLVFDALFKDMYGRKEDNEVLNNYVIDSFAVVMSMRNLYDEGAVNIGKFRKSGHFGSRVASAAMLHQLLDENTQKSVYELFDNVKNARATNDLEAEKNCINEVAEPMTELFRKEFIQAAANAELVYESRNVGLDLLGTTLCATIVRENEEDVDAFYLVAGDSLPFMLDKDGLCEVMHAHEGADGGMTNRVRANDDQIIEAFRGKKEVNKFYLEPKVVTVKKPCVLFNASDGVFDCFTHPILLEKLILDNIVKANSYEELSNALHDYFVAYCSIDDSSTLAAKFFGFESYEQVKEFAQKRLDDIAEQYLNEANGGLPTLFEVNYEIAKNNLQSKGRDNLNKVFFTINGNPKVAEFYAEQIRKRNESIEKTKRNLDYVLPRLEKFKEELKYHREQVILNKEEDKKVEQMVREALTQEIQIFAAHYERFQNILASLEAEELYKSFREEWTAKGVVSVKTLVAGGVYTEEEMVELLNKFDVTLDDKPNPELQKLEELALHQQRLLEKYDVGYNRLCE